LIWENLSSKARIEQMKNKRQQVLQEHHYVANQTKAKRLWFQTQIKEIVLHSRFGLL
jgi:hypothetical protein